MNPLVLVLGLGALGSALYLYMKNRAHYVDSGVKRGDTLYQAGEIGSDGKIRQAPRVVHVAAPVADLGRIAAGISDAGGSPQWGVTDASGRWVATDVALIRARRVDPSLSEEQWHSSRSEASHSGNAKNAAEWIRKRGERLGAEHAVWENL